MIAATVAATTALLDYWLLQHFNVEFVKCPCNCYDPVTLLSTFVLVVAAAATRPTLSSKDRLHLLRRQWCTVCSKKSDAKNRNHNNCHKSHQNSTAQFLSNSCLKNGTQKQKFPIWKSRLSNSYAIPSVTVCAESGRHLHKHLHVSCADRIFSAATRLPVCRPCSVNLPQKSVQCWTRPVLVRKFLQQLSGTVTLTLP